MKKFTTKTLNYILLGALAVIFFVISCFGLGNMKAPSSYYSTGEIDGAQYNALVYELDFGSNEKLDSVWINFGSKNYYNLQETLHVYARMAASESSTMVEIKHKQLNAGQITVGGWLQLASASDIGSSSNRSFFMLAFTGQTKVKVNEIAFVGSKNEQLFKLGATAYASGQKNSLTDTLINSSTLLTDAEGKAYANKLIDEQRSFNLSNIDGDTYVNDGKSLLTPTEILTAEGVKNLVDGNASYVDGETNPLGAYLLALGCSIFGYNPVGMRIMPLLFTVGTIVLLFFLGKLITGREVCGLLLSFLYAMNGYSLSFATVGNVAAIFVFFVVLSVYFTFRFYRYGINSKTPLKGFLNLLFAGVAFTGALLTKSQALFALPVILAIFTFGLVRQYKKFSKLSKEQNSAVTKKELKANFAKNSLPQVGVLVTGFALLPLLALSCFFLIGYPFFSSAYGTTSLFGYMTKHFTNMFKLGSMVSGGHFALNMGAVDLGGKFIFGNLLTNYLTLVASVGALGYLIYTLVCKKAQTSNKFNTLVYPVIALLVGFISFVICYVVFISAYAQCVEMYMLANLFACFIATLLFNTLDVEYKKPLVIVKGQSITLTGIITIALAFVILIMWALAVPSLVGLSSSLVNVNVLGFVVKGGK